MGLFDKAKAQAEQAIAKAQQGMVQGQARLDHVQAKRQTDGLLRSLGATYYAQIRQGGSPEAVSSALAALDAFVAEQGPIDTSSSSSTSGVATPPGSSTGQQTPAAPSTTAGDFKLDDM